jgi:excisionase family DNA binding protein
VEEHNVMTITEAALAANVSLRTMRRWCATDLPSVRVGRVRRVLRQDLTDFIQAHRRVPA